MNDGVPITDHEGRIHLAIEEIGDEPLLQPRAIEAEREQQSGPEPLSGREAADRVAQREPFTGHWRRPFASAEDRGRGSTIEETASHATRIPGVGDRPSRARPPRGSTIAAGSCSATLARAWQPLPG